MFSCEFCKIFKNIFFHRTPLVAASDTKNKLQDELTQYFQNTNEENQLICNLEIKVKGKEIKGKYCRYAVLLLHVLNIVRQLKKNFFYNIVLFSLKWRKVTFFTNLQYWKEKQLYVNNNCRQAQISHIFLFPYETYKPSRYYWILNVIFIRNY